MARTTQDQIDSANKAAEAERLVKEKILETARLDAEAKAKE